MGVGPLIEVYSYKICTLQQCKQVKDQGFGWHIIKVVVVHYPCFRFFLSHFAFHFEVFFALWWLQFVLCYNPNSPCVDHHSHHVFVLIEHGNHIVTIDFLFWLHILILDSSYNTTINLLHPFHILILDS
jgi:hypothetical protein